MNKILSIFIGIFANLFLFRTFSYSLPLPQTGFALTPQQNNFYEDLEAIKDKSFSLENKKNNTQASSLLLSSKKLFWTPKLSAEVSRQMVKEDSNYASKDSLGVRMQWNLFKGGSSLNQMNSAKANLKASELAVINEELDVEVQSSNLIFKMIYLKEIVRNTEEILKLKEDVLKLTTERYKQGKLPRHELIKAEVDLNSQKIRLRESQINLNESISEIQTFYTEKLRSDTWPFSENNRPQSLHSNIYNKTLIEEKEWISKSFEEDWKSSKSLHYPNLDFNLSYEKPFSTTEQNKGAWIGMLTLSIPIWNNLENSAYIGKSYVGYQAALNDYKFASQKWNQKTNFLKQQIHSSQSNLIEAKKNVTLAKELYNEVYRAFQIGRISMNDLFTEQSRLIEAQNSLSINQLSFHQAITEYCTLSGYKISECIR